MKDSYDGCLFFIPHAVIKKDRFWIIQAGWQSIGPC